MLKNFSNNCRNNRTISIFTSISYHFVFTRPPFLFFQLNRQYDTLLPIIPCTHKLKAGIAIQKKNFRKKFFPNNDLHVNNFLGQNFLARVRFNCFRGTYPKFSVPYFRTLPEKHKYFAQKMTRAPPKNSRDGGNPPPCPLPSRRACVKLFTN
jgi:hypothetical protein